MRLLTKAEACRELRLSLSTLNRRIAAGEVPVKREPRGRRHRVYVMLDDDSPGSSTVTDSAQAQIRRLEERLELLQNQLELERQRNAGLVDELKAAQKRSGPWWRFWQRLGDETKFKTPQTGRWPAFCPTCWGQNCKTNA